jgi:hypothetical protein
MLPEGSIIFTVFEQQGNAWPLLAEGDGVSVFPKVPTTHQGEGGAGGSWDHRRDGVGVKLLNPGIWGKKEAERTPEATREPALEDDVIGGFLGAPANGTGGFSNSEDALPEQGTPRLNAGFGEEPSEETHFGRGVVMPDKGTGRGVHAAPGPEPV